MEISIIILNYNNWQDTNLLVEQLSIQLTPELENVIELVVFDNGSTNDSKRYLNECISECRNALIRYSDSKKNYGFGGGINRALNCCDSRYALLLNPDIVIKSDFLSELLKLKLNDLTVYGFPTYNFKNKKLAFWGGYKVSKKRLNALPCGIHESPDYINGSAIVVPRNTVFHEDFFLYWEDAYLGRTLKEKGVKLRVTDIAVYDKGSTTIGKGKLAYYYYHRNSLFYFYGNVSLRNIVPALLVKSAVFISYVIRFKNRDLLEGVYAGFVDWIKNQKGKKNEYIH